MSKPVVTDLGTIHRAQQAMLRYLASLQPGGALGRALKYAAIAAHRYTTSITHVWRVKGGALRMSHRVQLQDAQKRAVVSIDQATINPRGQRPSVYGPFEHARGGSHAFYARTEREYGKEAAVVGARTYLGDLK